MTIIFYSKLFLKDSVLYPFRLSKLTIARSVRTAPRTSTLAYSKSQCRRRPAVRTCLGLNDEQADHESVIHAGRQPGPPRPDGSVPGPLLVTAGQSDYCAG